MNFRKILLLSAAVLFCTASISAQVSPQIPHTWVSGSGTDANPCTFALPCLTFQGALTKTTVGGLITAKDTGDFGSVDITQSVTIDGSNLGTLTFAGVTTNGVTISGGGKVTVRNLSIDGLGTGYTGIFIANGSDVIVDNCRIENVSNDGIFFEGVGNLTVENSRIEYLNSEFSTGIEIYGNFAENVVVKNTFIDASPTSNISSGFVVDQHPGSVTASLQNVTIMNAGNFAVELLAGTAQITGSVLTQSSTAVAAYNGSTISVASSLITSNNTGVCSNTSSKIRLDNNDIYDNTTAIASCGGIVKTSTTNKTSGTIAIPASDVSDSVTF